MKCLLDTGVFLWSMDSFEKLNQAAQDILTGVGKHELYLSAVSAWEIAIKSGLGKLQLPEPPTLYVPNRMRMQDIKALTVTHTHALGVSDLDLHHKDPFDRLLIAQARTEGMTLMTADFDLRKYPVEILWCGK